MQLNKNKYFKDIVQEENKLGFVIANELRSPERHKAFTFSFEDISLDITRQLISTNQFAKLKMLGEEIDVEDKKKELFEGSFVNVTENRFVTHFLERNPNLVVNKTKRYKSFISFLKQKKIKNLINVGIGGSDLGIKMVYHALENERRGPSLTNISNLDFTNLENSLKMKDIRETFFIFNSKSFSTEETLVNLRFIKSLLNKEKLDLNDHVVAVTSFPEKAMEAGFKEQAIFQVPKGVGGRFSMWSHFGLGLVASLGLNVYEKLLAGAYKMDKHFLEEKLEMNLPYILGLTRVWNRNVLNLQSLAIVPYESRLKFFPTWFQQVEMESNGKSFDAVGNKLELPAAPLVFGEIGTESQHSFFQLLHQGIEKVPVEFLVPFEGKNKVGENYKELEPHSRLIVNAIAQAEALITGTITNKDNYKNMAGNRPSTFISWDRTNAESLGKLLSLYENATIVCGLLWGINSFDQWGVELGKEISRNIYAGQKLEDLSFSARKMLKDIL
jgi:glucose-6-phosphate isomerase